MIKESGKFYLMLFSRVCFSFCARINNQMKLLSRIPSKKLIESFLSSQQFSNNDIAALLLSLEARRPASIRKVAGKIAASVDTKLMTHRELSIVANHLSRYAGAESYPSNIWEMMAVAGLRVMEDFDRDSLPRYLDAMDRCE